jgi:hypothetical protein
MLSFARLASLTPVTSLPAREHSDLMQMKEVSTEGWAAGTVGSWVQWCEERLEKRRTKGVLLGDSPKPCRFCKCSELFWLIDWLIEPLYIAHISILSNTHGTWPMFWPVLRRCHILRLDWSVLPLAHHSHLIVCAAGQHYNCVWSVKIELTVCKANGKYSIRLCN